MLAAISLSFFSCKKETSFNQESKASDNALVSVVPIAKWKGAFISQNSLPPSASVSDKIFIKEGYARIYKDPSQIDAQNYYGTAFRLIIPAGLKIKGDSINFEAGVKNPSDASFFSPYHGRDVMLYIRGESNEALINNVVTNDINATAKKRAAIKLGQTVRNRLPQLQYNFEDYGTLILQTFNRGVVAYRNNEYLAGLAYANEPLIGRLKEIGIVFKGSGYVDYIKIYNSVNGDLLLSEDFNTDGESTVVIY